VRGHTSGPAVTRISPLAPNIGMVPCIAPLIAHLLKTLTSVGNVTVRFMPFIFIFREWEGGPPKKIP
jgi:hypothetical protein